MAKLTKEEKEKLAHECQDILDGKGYVFPYSDCLEKNKIEKQIERLKNEISDEEN